MVLIKMLKNFLVTYDITNERRAYHVRKLVYSYAMSGQKSALEVLLDNKELKELLKLLKILITDDDRINIIEVDDRINIIEG